VIQQKHSQNEQRNNPVNKGITRFKGRISKRIRGDAQQSTQANIEQGIRIGHKRPQKTGHHAIKVNTAQQSATFFPVPLSQASGPQPMCYIYRQTNDNNSDLKSDNFGSKGDTTTRRA